MNSVEVNRLVAELKQLTEDYEFLKNAAAKEGVYVLKSGPENKELEIEKLKKENKELRECLKVASSSTMSQGHADGNTGMYWHSNSSAMKRIEALEDGEEKLSCRIIEAKDKIDEILDRVADLEIGRDNFSDRIGVLEHRTNRKY